MTKNNTIILKISYSMGDWIFNYAGPLKHVQISAVCVYCGHPPYS